VWVILIVENPTMTVPYVTKNKSDVSLLKFVSVKLDSLSCSLTSVSFLTNEIDIHEPGFNMLGIHQLTIPEKSLHLVITDFIFVFNISDEQNSVLLCIFITTYHKLPIKKGRWRNK